jgi:catechol 2,3-dioxygenase-like lactoylglutathione lyase family enzyme
MLSGPRWLALEVKYLDRARSFYEAFLGLNVRRESETEAALAVGETDLVLRTPGTVPRGGLHTHYAMSVPAAEYDDWYDRLDDRFDLVEHQFGAARSLYFYDTEGNCVELGERAEAGAAGVSSVFEVVLEVEDLSRALELYRTVGFETVEESDDRRRARLTCDAFDVELWEPHLGLADARGGVHVDLGVETDDPAGIGEAVAEPARTVEHTDRGVRVRDHDGHSLSLVEEDRQS